MKGRAAGPGQRKVSLRQKVILAAVECSGGDLDRTFTAEDLLLAAWKKDPLAWGLRGHEREHPDSEKIYVELDRASVRGRNVRGGLVGLGLLEKVRQRTYRLTRAGLVAASEVEGTELSTQVRAKRAVADAVGVIVSHPVFRDWLKDPGLPKHFRDAGHFWGIAAGTPPGVIRSRILDVDKTLELASASLDDEGITQVGAKGGQMLFDRQDVDRARAFQAALKERFGRELSTLGVSLT